MTKIKTQYVCFNQEIYSSNQNEQYVQHDAYVTIMWNYLTWLIWLKKSFQYDWLWLEYYLWCNNVKIVKYILFALNYHKNENKLQNSCFHLLFLIIYIKIKIGENIWNWKKWHVKKNERSNWFFFNNFNVLQK